MGRRARPRNKNKSAKKDTSVKEQPNMSEETAVEKDVDVSLNDSVSSNSSIRTRRSAPAQTVRDSPNQSTASTGSPPNTPARSTRSASKINRYFESGDRWLESKSYVSIDSNTSSPVNGRPAQNRTNRPASASALTSPSSQSILETAASTRLERVKGKSNSRFRKKEKSHQPVTENSDSPLPNQLVDVEDTLSAQMKKHSPVVVIKSTNPACVEPAAVEERLKSPDRLLKQLESTLSPKYVEPLPTIAGLSVSRFGRIQKHKENNDYIPQELAKFITKTSLKPRSPKMFASAARQELAIEPKQEPVESEDQAADNGFLLDDGTQESLDFEVIAKIVPPTDEGNILGMDQIKIVGLDVSFGDGTIGGDIQVATEETLEVPIEQVVEENADKAAEPSDKVLEQSGEEDSAKGSSLDLDNTNGGYAIGQLFWASLNLKTIGWPCMVRPEPESGHITSVKTAKAKKNVMVHVTFFADNGRRSWVSEALMIAFTGLEEFKMVMRTKDSTMRARFSHALRRCPRWVDAITQAEEMLGCPIESRESHFLNLLDRQSVKGRRRERSLSAGYATNSLDGSLELGTKRMRSPTPESPAYEALPTTNHSKSSEPLPKRMKEDPEDPDLFRSTIARYFQSMADGSDLLETASGTSSECEDITEMAGFDRETYNDLLNVNRWYVFEGQAEAEIDKKLQKYVQKICALRMLPTVPKNTSNARISNRLRSQALRNLFLKFEQELGIGSSRKEAVPEPGPVANKAAPPKSKKESKSLEELFVFDLDKNYLMKGVPKGFVCVICLKSNNVTKCSKCHNYYHLACLPQQEKPPTTKESTESKSFNCTDCIMKKPASCFVCNDQDELLKDERKHRCAVTGCARCYHIPCLRLFPQHKLTSTTKSSTLFCPCHTCHTCVSDDPRTNATTTKGQLIRCIKCPSSYHPDAKCIPAGSQLLTNASMICPKHSFEQCSVNVNWCFLCCKGGSLICCETCPTAFHLDCLKFTPPEGKYICEECESGRMPLYNEIVFAKYSNFRFWPALIVPPPEIPDFVLRKQHVESDICIMFFGSHDYGWINRRRLYLYQEGDSDNIPERKKGGIGERYNDALREAKIVHNLLQAKKADEPADLGESSFKPPMYVKIKSNRYVPPLKPPSQGKEEKEDTMCECKSTDEDPCGPNSNCINRALLVECNPEVCPAGKNCQNQYFERKQYPALVAKRVPSKGWGLVATEDIRQGQFVIEYVGEVINNEELTRRLQQKQEQMDENYYFLTVDSELTIDAGPRGNLARFINHSCQPNCETMLWKVRGAQSVGLFAIQDIKAGEELTFNYNFASTGDKKKICHCGAAKCSGFIGKKYRPPVEEEPSTSAVIKRRKSIVSKAIKRRRHSVHVSALFNKKLKALTQLEGGIFRAGDAKKSSKFAMRRNSTLPAGSLPPSSLQSAKREAAEKASAVPPIEPAAAVNDAASETAT